MAMAIIEHNLPYSFVEYRRVREMLLICNPDVNEYTRNTAVNDVGNVYLDKKMELKQQLSRSPSRICLTSDCWTAYTVEGYICITAHFVDRNWKLNSKILAFCKIEPPHTGLKAASTSIQKSRESIKYVKQSEARRILFAKCVEQVGGIDDSVGLKLDVPTRWNSIYVMLDSVMKYQRAFGSLVLRDKNFISCPSSEKWKRGELIRDFLAPFYIITNLFFGSCYPTSNLYFMQIWKIERLLKIHEDCDDLILKDMTLRMKVKFEKYWSDYSVILSIVVVLDPRLKFDLINFCYEKSDSIGWENKVNVVKRKMHQLFKQYDNEISLVSTSTSTSSSSQVQVDSSHAP
ncbi:PREDICTED: zinc finger BED domain-containing protein RICESLEEPER 2-like [Ipomoea nil]|uniref:zinc finger BED domain-containing protein RICESLEEPER 2-like n=1 Tax=Ipomoea nil TaxID=35883 RepID=UPI000901FBF0|nr:PREDICTED: zinc finger BED domain-containing protein RICESLEEPER 2-like [Ipomoea nil]